MYKRNEAHCTCSNLNGKEMYEKLLVLVTLVLLIPQLSAGGTCSSQDVTGSIEQKIKGNYEQINELLAPVSTFLQATLMKQIMAEYGINPINITYKNELLLHQLMNETTENKKAIL